MRGNTQNGSKKAWFLRTGQVQMLKSSDSGDASQAGPKLEVILDGLPVIIPKERRSISAIRSFLETLAFEQQHILCSLSVDGKAVDLSRPEARMLEFSRIEAETMPLEQMPIQVLRNAMRQAALATEHTLTAVTLVIINEADYAWEIWWNLVRDLKAPLVTLSLMPETASGPVTAGASLLQLRKWQLQQLGSIITDVDETCGLEETVALSNALEYRVLPWLEGLETLLELWHTNLMAGEVQSSKFKVQS
jgi:hypothetical protein